jgi:hypothetical protein
VLVVVSLVTPPLDDAKLAGLTFATAKAAQPGAEQAGRKLVSNPLWRRRDVWLSILLAGCVGLVWLYFTG